MLGSLVVMLLCLAGLLYVVGARRDAPQIGIVGQVERLVLIQDRLVELSVLGEHELVVEAGHQEDVMHPVTHQILEA